MTEHSTPPRDLLSLGIDANHHVHVLEARAELLEDLVVKLAAQAAETGSNFPSFTDEELELVQVAQRGSAARERWRRSRAERDPSSTPTVRAVPDLPAQK